MNLIIIILLVILSIILLVAVLSIAIILALNSEDSSNEGLLHNSKLIFIHIPKTAGTTIYELAKEKGFNWRYTSSSCRCSKWHMPPTRKHNLNIPMFCVVRNPYTRIISQYKYKNNKTSIDGLNKYIKSRIRALKANKYIEDCHWIPQYEYAKHCDHVLAFENLESEFNSLMNKYDIDIRLTKHSNKSKERNLNISDITPSNIKKINEIYDIDFNKLGYTKSK
jgi:hypothetical protein